MSHLAAELFIAFFRPCTRVLFDWQRMEREQWAAEIQVGESAEIFSSLYVPWYMGRNGSEVNYQAADATPIAVADIPDLFSRLDAQRQRAILQIAEDFRAKQPPIQFAIPLYCVGQAQYLLLDGNHRMAALAISQMPFRIMTFAVHGPIQGDILPDLRHWAAD